MNSYAWYAQLQKPSWSPPSWLFGPVWTVLYALIAVSYGYVAYLFLQKRISFWVVLPFGLNLIFNALFTPVQFGLRNNWLAMADILLVLVTLVWALIAVYPHARWVTYVNIPYIVWVCFATVLQISITILNKG